MKRFLCTALSLGTMLLVCTGCFHQGGDKEELVYCVEQAPDRLVPVLEHNESAGYLCELVFDGLVNKTDVDNGREKYEYALAKKYGFVEQLKDRRFITIELKRGVYWHDGREFTAADVVYTFDAIRASDSPLKSWLEAFVESYEKVERDNYSVRLKLVREMSVPALMDFFSPVKILPHRFLDDGVGGMLPRNLNDGSSLSEAFAWKPIGTGPYRIRERTSQEVVLDAHSSYQPSAPEIETVRMRVVGNLAMGVRMLTGGENAFLFDVKPEHFDMLRDLPLSNTAYLPHAFYALVYNTSSAPFSDPNFRKGVTRGIDRGRLVRSFLGDGSNAAAATNSSIFPTSSVYVQDCRSCFESENPYDLQQARRLIGRAVVSQPAFRLLVSSALEGERCQRLAREIGSMMRDIGVQVSVDDMNAAQYYNEIRTGGFQAALVEFSGFDHLYDFRPLFGENNYWRVHDGRLAALLNEFGRTLSWESYSSEDEDTILGLRDLGQGIHDRVEKITPACFLFTAPRRAYYSDKLIDVTIHPEVGFATIEKWTLMQE